MFLNYFKTAWRLIIRNKSYSALNIGGLAVGLAVAMLIGLWMYDELSYNKYHQNYDRIAQVMQNSTYNGVVSTQEQNPMPLGNELRTVYGNDFKYVVMSSGTRPFTLASGIKKFTENGGFFEPEVVPMLTLKMLKGTRSGLKDPASILLSESVAKTIFGNSDPVGKFLKIDDTYQVKVTGVYEDLPAGSKFSDLAFIAPWQLYISNEPAEHQNDWSYNSFQTYVQLADQADMAQVSAKIKNIKQSKVNPEEAKYKPEIFLHPMRKWHLYSEFENGVSVGGRIQFVRLFGIIGGFVLLLACINFMNLATARAEKRAKEVGIRKAIGSVRGQLISQFFCESLLVVTLAFIVSLILVQVLLPFFNEIADKK